MFTEPKPTCSTLELTDKLAQEIYTAMVKYGNITKTFTAPDTNFDYTNVIKVDTEIKRIHNEITQKMSGSFMLTPYIPAVMDKGGIKVLSPAVEATYFVVSTQGALTASMSETLLDSVVAVQDLIAYTGGYDSKRTWAEYKEGFEGEV